MRGVEELSVDPQLPARVSQGTALLCHTPWSCVDSALQRKLRSVNGQGPTQRHNRTQSPAVVYLTCQGQAPSAFVYTVRFTEILQVLLSMLNMYKRTDHVY